MKTTLGSSRSSRGKKKKCLNDQGEGNDEHEGKSVSENLGTLTEEDNVENENPCKKPKCFRRTRYSQEQIQALEALFRECPHPDENQRIELGRKISLDQIQVKFWFQNRRSQLKGQIDNYENTLLKEENERLNIERIAVKNAKANPICGNCGGRLKLKDPSIEELNLRIQNVRLKDEVSKVRALCSKFIGPLTINPKPSNTSEFVDPKPPLLDLALKANEELLKIVQMGEPLWIKDIGSGKEKLNYETYMQVFPRCIGTKPAEFVYETTRDTGTLTISCMELVEILMNAKQWAEMFPSMKCMCLDSDSPTATCKEYVVLGLAAPQKLLQSNETGTRSTGTDQSRKKGNSTSRPAANLKEKVYNRYTPDQNQVLEEFYCRNPHPDANDRKQLGEALGFTDDRIKYWFQNRRAVDRRKSNKSLKEQLKEKTDILRIEIETLKLTLLTATCESGCMEHPEGGTPGASQA